MPEFYNRFKGRNDLMDYAKVKLGLHHHPWPSPAALPVCSYWGSLVQWHKAKTDPHVVGD